MLRLKEEFENQERRILTNAKLISECKKLSQEMVLSSYERDEKKKNEITENEITAIKVSIDAVEFEEEKQRLTESLELLETSLSCREELIKNYRSTITSIQKVKDVTAQISKNSTVKNKKLPKKKNLKKKPSFESQLLKADDYHKKQETNQKKKAKSARARRTGQPDVDAGTVDSDQATHAANITDAAANITDAAANITDAEEIPIAAADVVTVSNNDNVSKKSESNMAKFINFISFPDVIVIE